MREPLKVSCLYSFHQLPLEVMQKLRDRAKNVTKLKAFTFFYAREAVVSPSVRQLRDF